MSPGDPCTFGECGRGDTHPYAEGPRCPAHTPAARAGRPDPDTARYCLAICYCGGCPARPRLLTPIRDTVTDLDAVRSGKRRASEAALRNARAQTRRR